MRLGGSPHPIALHPKAPLDGWHAGRCIKSTTSAVSAGLMAASLVVAGDILVGGDGSGGAHSARGALRKAHIPCTLQGRQ